MGVGDLVVIHSHNRPPMSWRHGRLMEVHPGPDGVFQVVYPSDIDCKDDLVAREKKNETRGRYTAHNIVLSSYFFIQFP